MLPKSSSRWAAFALLLSSSACGGAQTEPQHAAAFQGPPPARPCDANFTFEPGTTYYFVAPDGNDEASGSCQAPMATLQAVEQKIRAAEGVRLESGWPTHALANSYTVYVRGGTYLRQEPQWRAASLDRTKWVRILAYPGERPIFDGEGKLNRGFHFETGFGQITNFQISGITWRHYNLGLGVFGRRIGTTSLQWTGGAIISDNVFEEIGDVYDHGLCARKKKEDKVKACFGSSMVGMRVASYNVVERNVFIRGESRDSKNTFGRGSRAVMHALYISEYSNNNIIRNNYMGLISGDPVRLRWGSSNNQIYGNYMTDSGATAFVSCWFQGDDNLADAPCVGNLVQGNVFTFGYPWTDSRASRCVDPIPEVRSMANGGIRSSRGLLIPKGNIVLGQRPRHETVAAMTTGDLDSDGNDELVVALNYDSQLTKIVATDGKTPYLSRVIYAAPSSSTGEVTALSAGRFDESGRDQLVSAWQMSTPNVREEVWRGDGRPLTSGLSGARNLGSIDRRDAWLVDALTSGNFDGDGSDELLIAMHRFDNGRAAIFHGDGQSSRGSRIYLSQGEWSVLAMAAGDLDGDGKESVFTAFYPRQAANGVGTLRLYEGDGVDSVQNRLIFETQGATAKALAVSSSDSQPRRLYAVFDTQGGAESAIRYAPGDNPGAFTDVEGTAQKNGRITHLAILRGKAVSASEDQKEDTVSDSESEYHRWDQPTGKVRCRRH